VPGIVDDVVYIGPTTQVRVRLPHGPAIQALLLNEDGARDLTSGTAVSVGFHPDAVRVLTRDRAPDRVQTAV
jgi:hypothetical protein